MIFLSHSWNEKPVARKVVEALARRGLPAWLDEQQLAAGVRLRSALLDAIAKSNVCVYLVSEEANRSEWVQDELHQAVELERDGLQIVPVRLAGDSTPLPSLLTGRLYQDLSEETGGVARLAHDLASLPNAGVLPQGARIASTVRLGSRRVEHTLAETAALSVEPTARHVLILNEDYERIDALYWSFAEQSMPAAVQGRPEDLAYADNVLDGIHSACRGAIEAVPALAGSYVERRAAPHREYYVAAIERLLYVLLHRLDWSCRYLACLRGDGVVDQKLLEERDVPEPFSGHLCEFVADGRSLGKAKVSSHDHPWAPGRPLEALRLSSPFADMVPAEVGVAIGDTVARRFLARTRPSVDLPLPETLLYGLA